MKKMRKKGFPTSPGKKKRRGGFVLLRGWNFQGKKGGEGDRIRKAEA